MGQGPADLGPGCCKESCPCASEVARRQKRPVLLGLGNSTRVDMGWYICDICVCVLTVCICMVHGICVMCAQYVGMCVYSYSVYML